MEEKKRIEESTERRKRETETWTWRKSCGHKPHRIFRIISGVEEACANRPVAIKNNMRETEYVLLHNLQRVDAEKRTGGGG